MPKNIESNLRPLTNNPDYETLINQRFLASLESNSDFKKLDLKLNICIGLLVLKLFLMLVAPSIFII